MRITEETFALNPNTTDYSGIPYPFGMDPVRINLPVCTVMVEFKVWTDAFLQFAAYVDQQYFQVT